MNRLQKSFYTRTFKPRFLAGDPVDVQDQDGYGIVMLHEFLDQWEHEPDAAANGMKRLRDAYPRSSVASAARGCLRDISLLKGRWSEAFELASSSERLPLLLGLADELDHPRLRPMDVFRWNHGRVSKAAYQVLGTLLEKLDTDLNAFHDAHGISIIEDFWNRLSADSPVDDVVVSIRDDVSPDLDDEDIVWNIETAREIGLFFNPTAFSLYEGRERPIPLPRPWPRPEVYGHLWPALLKPLTRSAENYARSEASLPRVGEGLVSETRLLNELKAAFPDQVINHQVRPTWLAPQSLDIVFTEHRIAVEYQGVQHSRPVDYFGGKKAFEDQQMRDAYKQALCEENGMRLIEALPSYVLTDLVGEIQNTIEGRGHDNS